MERSDIINTEDITAMEAYFAERNEADQLWEYLTEQEIETLRQRRNSNKKQFEEGGK